MISNTSGNTSYTHTNHKKDRKLFCELFYYTFHNIHHSCPLHYFKYFSLTHSLSSLKISKTTINYLILNILSYFGKILTCLSFSYPQFIHRCPRISEFLSFLIDKGYQTPSFHIRENLFH